MSRFSSEFRANATKAEIIRSGQSILEEMGLLFEDRNEDLVIFKEKLRFDPYNPVEVQIRVTEKENGSMIEIKGNNMGLGPYQDTHVKRLIFELMDRMQSKIGSSHDMMDPNIVSELQLLSKLHSTGILTDVEYSRAKQKLLD